MHHYYIIYLIIHYNKEKYTILIIHNIFKLVHIYLIELNNVQFGTFIHHGICKEIEIEEEEKIQHYGTLI